MIRIPFEFYLRSILIGWINLCIGFYMDLTFSRDEYNELKKKKDLWNDAWKSIQINLLGITPISYLFLISSPFFLSKKEMKLIFEFPKFLALIFIQNGMYFIIHYIMHRYLYFIHQFHHQFQSILIPSIAFAVSSYEFLVAYLLPFFIGCIIIKPTEITLLCSVFFISMFNFIIHTSKWKDIKWIPYFVSPKDHLEHHEKRTTHYSAPFLSFDKIFF